MIGFQTDDDDQPSVEELTVLVRALETYREQLAQRLQVMTAEATEGWARTARMSQQIARLEADLEKANARLRALGADV